MTKKKKDPYYERESRKYDNPIPSREFILEFLDNHDGPATFQEVFSGIGLTDEEEVIALKRRLRAMERDGQLLKNRKEGYAPIDKLDLKRGHIQGHKEGYGFFISDEGGDDWFLSAREMRYVFHGERVVVRQKGFDAKGRVEAGIVEILESETPLQLVGRYFDEEGIGFVEPSDNRFIHDILIPSGQAAGATSGQVVVVRVTSRPKHQSKALGAVIQVLGDYLAAGMEIDMAIHNYGIRRDWPEAVLEHIRTLPIEVQEKDWQGRQDLRKLPLVTIDGEDARDFDDAVYCEPKASGGWRLWVAIADVSYYVTPGSALDKEASLRTTSVYFPDYVVPMLPEQLSNGLCSLNPNVDRLCMVCELSISVNGKVTRSKFYPAVMHSKARLTYDQVWDILQCNKDEQNSKDDQNNKDELPQTTVDLKKHLLDLYALYQTLATVRKSRGAIEFDTKETKIVFNEHRKIDYLEAVERNDAHRIIEECMICANVAAAKFFLKKKIPGLYRVHQGPSEKKLEDLRNYLGVLGLVLFGGSHPSPADYAEVLQGIKQRPDFDQIQTMLLRSMNQAVYSEDNQGHFGLAFDAYTHFTSPIRRYPDLLVHRMIKNRLLKDSKLSDDDALINDKHHTCFYGSENYSEQQLAQLGEICSQMERQADLATRDVIDWLKCEFMTDKIGQQYQGEVVTVLNFGLFVRLDDFFVDGLIHVTSLERDYFHYEQAAQCLKGERTGVNYYLGDKVLIEVSAVDLEDRKIDFELVELLESSQPQKSQREKLYKKARGKTKNNKKEIRNKKVQSTKTNKNSKTSKNNNKNKKTHNRKNNQSKSQKTSKKRRG